jgi:hypothetical protein
VGRTGPPPPRRIGLGRTGLRPAHRGGLSRPPPRRIRLARTPPSPRRVGSSGTHPSPPRHHIGLGRTRPPSLHFVGLHPPHRCRRRGCSGRVTVFVIFEVVWLLRLVVVVEVVGDVAAMAGRRPR